MKVDDFTRLQKKFMSGALLTTVIFVSFVFGTQLSDAVYTASVQHILVETQQEADDVIRRLRSKENFGDLAKELSLCPSRARGGDLGTVMENELTHELNEALFPKIQENTAPNTLKIVRTSFGYHVLRINKHMTETSNQRVNISDTLGASLP